MQTTKLLSSFDTETENAKHLEIRSAVHDFHRAGGSDWKLLAQQIQKQVKPLQYNLPQMVARQTLANPRYKDYKFIYKRWSRATGKTTDIGGLLQILSQMFPRGVGQFICPSFRYLLTRIIPSVVNGLEMHGLYQGIHYFIGEKPPKAWKWDFPYQPPKDFSKFLLFHTGFGMHFISQDVPGDGRGLNTDVEVGDESLMLSYDMMEENTSPALRGSNVNAFKDKPLFCKQLHSSSMPTTATGAWVFKLEEKNIEGENAILTIDANCKLNAHNLKPGYLEDARKKALNERVFRAEYLNERPNIMGPDNFYPLFNENIHGYRPDAVLKTKQDTCAADSDLVPGVPLRIGMDFGAAINYIVVSQYFVSLNEWRVIKDFWVTSENGKMQDDVVDDFAKYYKPHQATCKEIFFCYDRAGNVRTGNTRVTRAEQARDRLYKLGWRVTPMTYGEANEDHSRKFDMWGKILQNIHIQLVHRQLPVFKINIINARTTLISIQNSKALEGHKLNTTHKDKSIEKKLLQKGERQFATDGSDALDTIAVAFWADAVRFGGTGLMGISFGKK
jgi:hypothetical protein